MSSTNLKIRLHLPKASLTDNDFSLATTYLQLAENVGSYTVNNTTQTHLVFSSKDQ